METIAGFPVTGRSIRGPAADLVELCDDNGFRHTAIVFHEEYRTHPAIGPAVDVARGFLEDPFVTGLVELVGSDPQLGAFVYPTGESWSVGEIIRMLHDLGETGGIRAGLELLYAGGEILAEAAECGESQGVYSHGGLTPWRVLVKKDGQVQIIGHALPQVEILAFRDDDKDVPPADSFRYCPPERLDGGAEDVHADFFSLALVAFELMTGRPVYDGLVNEIRTQAARGEGSRRLFRFKEVLPKNVRDLLTVCVKADAEGRHPDAETFLEEVKKALSSKTADGPSLMDLMERVTSVEQRPTEELDAAKTMGVSKETLREMALAELGEQEPVARRENFEVGATQERRIEPEPASQPEPDPERVAAASSEAKSPPEPERELDVDGASDPGPGVKEHPVEKLGEDLVASKEAMLQKSGGRWGKPDRARRRKKSKDEKQEAERLTQTSADDLLASLRSSGSRDRPAKAKSSPKDATSVIDSILRSSKASGPSGPGAVETVLEGVEQVGGASEGPPSAAETGAEPVPEPDPVSAAETVAEPVPEPAPLPEPEPEPAPELDPEPAPLPEPEPEPEPAREPEAQSHPEPVPDPDPLLESKPVPELDSGPDPLPVSEPEPEETATIAVPIPPPSSDEPTGLRSRRRRRRRRIERSSELENDSLVTMDAPAVVPVDETANDDAATVMMTRPKPQQPKEDRTVPSKSPPPRVLEKPAAPLGERTTAEAGSGPSVQSIALLLGDSGVELNGVVASDATLAVACTWLHGVLLPVEASLDGRILAGWRLGTAAGPLPGETRVAELEQPLVLHRVANEARALKVRIEQDSQVLSFKVVSVIQVGAMIQLIARHKGVDLSDKWLHDGDRVIPPEALVDELSTERVLVLKG